MAVSLAFYKGRADSLHYRAFDTAVRLRTLSKYSHVELIPGEAGIGEKAQCFSASPRDGGVREKAINLTPGKWDIVRLAVPSEPPAARIREVIGAKYDFKGIMFSQALRLGVHSEDAWFCSELIAAALLFGSPHERSPGQLFDLCLIHPDYQGIVYG